MSLSMKEKIRFMIYEGVSAAYRNGILPSPEAGEADVEEPKVPVYGDFSTNIAMIYASRQKM
ncbi:MAG: arginine--tRNA ligase, partial [Thermodesulfobacteriota bacterium]